MNTPRALTSLTLLFILLNSVVVATAASSITSIKRTDETESLQVYFHFSKLPEYDLKTYKKRIDIRFKDTSPAKGIQLIKEDDRITRTLLRTSGEYTVFTMFFRYPPQQVKEKKRKKPASLMLDILLGHEFSLKYRDLSTRLQGLTLLNRDTVDYTNPVNISPYTENWFSFFSEYDPPVTVTPQINFTLPPFPIAQAVAGDFLLEEWLPSLIREKAAENQWPLATQMLLERVEQEPDDFLRDLLLLTYAESLVRAGEYKKPHKLLQQIIHRYKDTRLSRLAELLFTYVRVLHENDYLGYYDLKTVIEKIGDTTPFNAYFTVLLAETAMDMGRLDEAEKHLARDNIAFAGHADRLRALRRADLLYLKNEKVKALVSYLLLGEKSELILEKPAALARYADLLYLHKRYKKAAEAYERLGSLLSGKKQHDLALYRLAVIRWRAGGTSNILKKSLLQVQNAFPATEGAYRSMLKDMDIDYLFKKADSAKALAVYRKIAQTAGSIALREEAEFKQALVMLLDGDSEAAIKKCQSILREFQNGKLKVEARALIIKELPKVITEMVENKRYIDALVAAQQNRFFFTRGWLSTDFLYELAKAYNELGFFDRSARTYQYLFDTSPGTKQEDIYLPLIESLYKMSRFAVIEDYADRFSFRYPDSKYLPEIFLYRLNALMQSGDHEKINSLIDDPDRPTSEDIERFACSFYYEIERWNDVIAKLTAPGSSPDSESPEALMLAESYFQVGRKSDAAPLFESIAAAMEEQDDMNEQALFRLAQIYLENGKTKEALNKFALITEKGNDPLWKKLAREETAILNLQ